MDAKIFELLDLLDDETACYQDMQRILVDEETSISLSSKEPFDQVQNEKEFLVAKLQRLEESRKMLISRLSEAYLTNGKSITISQLANFVEQPIRRRLLDRASRLRSIIGHVHKKNRHNQMMINQYLDLIKGSLKLLTNLIEDNSIYQKPGTHQTSVGYHAGSGRFICGTV